MRNEYGRLLHPIAIIRHVQLKKSSHAAIYYTKRDFTMYRCLLIEWLCIDLMKNLVVMRNNWPYFKSIQLIMSTGKLWNNFCQGLILNDSHEYSSMIFMFLILYTFFRFCIIKQNEAFKAWSSMIFLCCLCISLLPIV